MSISEREVWDGKDLFSRAASPLSALKHTKKRQLPGKLSAFQITAITTALHDNKNVKKRKGHLHKAREKKLVTKARLAMVLHLIGRKRGVSFLNQLQSGMKQNHCNSGLFSTLDKKIALLSY